MKKLTSNIAIGAIFLSSSVFSIAQENTTPCAKLPDKPTSMEIRNSLIAFIAADIRNITMDGANRTYMRRLSSTVKEWTNLDCMDDQGFPRLNKLRRGISTASTVVQQWEKSRNWDASFKRVVKFRAEANDEALATLLEAAYWIDYAWDARGGGYASSVTPEGWALLKQRMESAEKVLLQNRQAASTIPSWYIYIFEVQSALGRPQKDRDAILIEGAQRYPKYNQLYEDVLKWFSPRWGGSWAMVDAFIEWATKNSMNVRGTTTYAWLYNSVRLNEMRADENLFKTTGAKWSRMKLGFEEHVVHFPNANTAIYNSIAATACEADDKLSFLKYRKKIGENIEASSWSKSYPMELCEAKYGFNQ